jgi:hypothetical protein
LLGLKNKIKGLAVANGEASLLLKIKSLGEEALDRVVITLGDIGNIAATAGNAIKKTAEYIADLVFEGSKVEQIDAQFEFLAKNAGVAADVLKNQLVGAVGGMVDDTELLVAANKALVTLGTSAADLPALMAQAKASSKLFGGTVVEQFDGITASIAAANTRGLRNAGIIIDQEQAFLKMANSLGIASAELSKQQQSQAILNAVLEKGTGALVEAGKASDEVGGSYKKLIVQMQQLHEAAARIANESLGGLFKTAFKNAASAVEYLADQITSKLGSSAASGQASFKLLTEELLRLETSLQQAIDGGVGERGIATITARINEVKNKIFAMNAEIPDRHSKMNDQIEARENKTTQLTLEQLQIRSIKRSQLEIASGALSAQNAIDHNAAMMAISLADEESKASLRAALNVKDAESNLAQNELLLSQTTDNAKKIELLKEKTRLQENLNRAKFNDQEAKDAKIQHDKLIADRAGFLSQISSLQSSSNSALVNLGRAAAIAQITISTSKAAAEGFSWGMAMGGPPLAAVFSGLAYAAGAANIATVAGVKLAEGGVVMPRPGGTPAIIGEAGQPEAVIPLDKMGGMGGGVTIIVNGGLLGDQASAREFAIAVDRQLLELRRNNESVSFDGRVI